MYGYVAKHQTLYLFRSTGLNLTPRVSYKLTMTHKNNPPLFNNSTRDCVACRGCDRCPDCPPSVPDDDRVKLSQVTTYQCGIIRGDISLLTCLCANSSGGTIVPQDTVTQTEIKVFYNKTTQASVAVKRTLLCLLPVSFV